MRRRSIAESTTNFVSFRFVSFRLKSIRKEIKVEAEKDQERKAKEKEKYDHREKYGTKQFGRHKFEEPDLDLNLSDEITGNLRTMKVKSIFDPLRDERLCR